MSIRHESQLVWRGLVGSLLDIHISSTLNLICTATYTAPSMLNALPRRREKVFGGTLRNCVNSNFWEQRRRLAQKLQNPRLLQITFHTLRHWKATTEYHRTRDILYVKQLLGHKQIQNTMLYTQLISFESDEYASAVAKNLDEARKLVEAGFEYVTEVDGRKLFRKRK